VAYEQGKIAGYNMAGVPRHYGGGLPMNSVEIYGLPIMSMGVTKPNGDGQREECVCEEGGYRKFVFDDDRLIGALLVGNVDHGGVLTHLIRCGRGISPSMRSRMLSGEYLTLSAQNFYQGAHHSGEVLATNESAARTRPAQAGVVTARADVRE
jgi:nitrite reductase (NADH) large subunit